MMKTSKFQIENGKASAAFDLLSEYEFFNFDMLDGDFLTTFAFENLTAEEEELISDLFSSLS